MISRLADMAGFRFGCGPKDVEVFDIDYFLWGKDCFQVFLVFEIDVGVSNSTILDFSSWYKTGFTFDLIDIICDVKTYGIPWKVAEFCTILISCLFVWLVVLYRVDLDTIFSDNVKPFLLKVRLYWVFEMKDDVGSLPDSINLENNSADISVLSELSTDVFFCDF